MELTLGLSEADLAKGDDASFAQLGGDSLAAIQFARAIDDLCGVPLPVSFVLDHSNSLAAITAKARGRYRLWFTICTSLCEACLLFMSGSKLTRQSRASWEVVGSPHAQQCRKPMRMF